MSFKEKSYFNYLSVFLVIVFASCAGTKNSTYFVDQPDGTVTSSVKPPETVIRAKDILGISVSSVNPEASNVFNSANFSFTTTTPNSQSVQTTGYLVDSSGFIQFPVLGNVLVLGKTTNQVKQEITNELVNKKLLVDATVSVRYINYRVTVLGEVEHPSTITIPGEKISLLEALGLAGDITIYGKKDNVLIIREQDGNKIIKHVNLNNSDLFNSPYYYLQSNDIVYVQANRARVTSAKQSTQLLPIILSALSFLAIIATQVINNNN